MKCTFCDVEAMTTVTVERDHDLSLCEAHLKRPVVWTGIDAATPNYLSLCEAHLKRLRFQLGDYTVTFSSANAEPIMHPVGGDD